MHYGAIVTCCSKSGCNWNYTTATKNLAVEDFSGPEIETSADIVSAGKAFIKHKIVVTEHNVAVEAFLKHEIVVSEHHAAGKAFIKQEIVVSEHDTAGKALIKHDLVVSEHDASGKA